MPSLEPYSSVGIPDDVPVPHFASARHPNAASTWANSAFTLTDNLPIHAGRVRELRPWQRYALTRALECDANGKLCWPIVVISAPRQVGKSVIERIACTWRLHQSELFGQTQSIVHVANKMNTALEIWQPVTHYFRNRYGKKAVYSATGQWRIVLPDGSRWLIQAANDSAGVGFSLTMILVDEAWQIDRRIIDASLRPTLTEAVNPQLWLVSTAGTHISDLMRSYRSLALSGSTEVLLLEWSASDEGTSDIADPRVWRQASPYWDEHKETYIRSMFQTTEEWAFRQQYLNQWVPNLVQPLLGPEVVREVETLEPISDGARVAFGVDVSPDRAHAAIVACADDKLEVVDNNDGISTGVAWVEPRIAELAARWNPSAIALDTSGPAQTIADRLAMREDIRDIVLTLNGRDMAMASGRLFDRLTERSIAVRANPKLQAALASATRRPYGQAWQFARDTRPSGVPLIAACLAMYAAEHAPESVEVSAIW